uniref:Uncharacterized protein n=1 Tax=Lactuca sativa TaxID=4236 RepID=A0A9R1XFV6_LACSA|nr:hypothetical protein LSAT_V11C400189320 [Lactuca sativa]
MSIRFPNQVTISQNRFVSYPVPPPPPPPPSYPPPSSLVATLRTSLNRYYQSRRSPPQHLSLVTTNQNWSVGRLPVTTVHRNSAGHHRPPAVELFCTSVVLSCSQN